MSVHTFGDRSTTSPVPRGDEKMGKHEYKHLETQPQASIAAGMDVHKYKIQAVVLARFGREYKALGEQPFMNDVNGRREACAFLDNYGLDIIVMEKTGAYSDAVQDALEKHHGWMGQAPRVVSIQPASVKRYPGEVHTDSRSALWLAKLGLSGFLDVSYIPSIQGRQLRDLTRMHEKHVRDSTQCINQIKDQLSKCGYMLPDLDIGSTWGLAFLKLLLSAEISGDIKRIYYLVDNGGVALHGSSKKAILERKAKYIRFSNLKLLKADRDIILMLLGKLSSVNALKEATSTSIEELVNGTPLLKKLVGKVGAIDAVSECSAATIIAEIDDIKRFPNVNKFLLYSGNAIAPDASGEHAGKPHMTKRCNQHLKHVFRNAGMNACEIVKNDSDIKRYATKQLVKNIKHKKIAYANTGAKIARIVYAILRYDVEYEPLHALSQKSDSHESSSRVSSDPEAFELKEIKKRARRFRNYVVQTREKLPPGYIKVLYDAIHEVWNGLT